MDTTEDGVFVARYVWAQDQILLAVDGRIPDSVRARIVGAGYSWSLPERAFCAPWSPARADLAEALAGTICQESAPGPLTPEQERKAHAVRRAQEQMLDPTHPDWIAEVLYLLQGDASAEALSAAWEARTSSARRWRNHLSARLAFSPSVLAQPVSGVESRPSPALAQRMVRMANVGPGVYTLNPLAGTGEIADWARAMNGELTCVEADPQRCAALRSKRRVVVEGDFLSYREPGWNAIVMWAVGAQGLEMVQHAYDLLGPYGKLVAVIDDAAEDLFWDWWEEVGGEEEELPGGQRLIHAQREL